MKVLVFSDSLLFLQELVRCLALAGCRIDVKTKDGITPELLALAQGHSDINDLLKRLKRVRNIMNIFHNLTLMLITLGWL